MRRFPGSRRHPQFAQAPLGDALTKAGIAYHWIAALGGRRRPRPDSPNTAWRNLQFRGYADYMASQEFEEGVDELLEVAGHLRTTLMCAEAVWWRCHRALIADALCVRGITVVHIFDEARAVMHPYTSPARIVHGRLSYVPTEGEPLAPERQLASQQAAEFACAARGVSPAETRDFFSAMVYCAAMGEAAASRMGRTPPTP